MAPMTTRCALALIVLLAVTPTRAAGPAITIDAASPSGKDGPRSGFTHTVPANGIVVPTPETR